MSPSESPSVQSHPDGSTARQKLRWASTPAAESQTLGNSIESIATAEASGNDPVAVVGLGASAGGIKVLKVILEGIPADSGLAFVVVMHLSPDYESNLTAVLQTSSALPVSQVTEAVRVEANHVYVIPPAHHIVMREGWLHLAAPQQKSGHRVAIDLFFRTLAAAYGQRAVCAVLSGTDSDGVIGLKHVKEQGGVTIAQEPDEAEYDSMPRTAVLTGMVDWVLPMDQIAPRLVALAQNEPKMQVPPEDLPESIGEGELPEAEKPGGPITAQQVPRPSDEAALRQVLALLRERTGHDFAHYKRATVLRRVARRMQVNTLEDIPSYLDFLRSHAPETSGLLNDLLINVTNFFRDPRAFAALEAHIPQIFSGKSASDQVRVWVCGCATGEEAYSVAILLSEHASKLEAPPSIQVFASDIDEAVIAHARSGLFPLTIEADVSNERLRRFFVSDQGRYRICQEVRERVLFAAHDVLRDSPFSRLDLVTCRNLLIYLKREAQERAFDIFHFGLRPGGLLFLGSSESMEDGHNLFAALDKSARIYVRRALGRPTWQVPMPIVPGVRALPASTGVPLSVPAPPSSTWEAQVSPLAPPAPNLAGDSAPNLLPGEAHLRLLERYAPPSVVVNEAHDIIHLSNHAGRFLQFSGGEPTRNLLKVAHPALRIELRTALFRAEQSKADVVASRVPIELDGAPILLDIHVRPDGDGLAQGLTLIVFEDVTHSAPRIEAGDGSEAPQVLVPGAVASELERECQNLKSQLATTVEQYESSTEELKSSNEELQAMNEEMRSATEELQTSKEELQSINEELTTVNFELKSNLDEVGRLNSDLQNLLTSTEIGTIFLDRQNCIKRFTPRVQELFNILPGDVGRPLSDLTHKLHSDSFVEEAAQVLRTLVPIEREVQTKEGATFMARLLPYHTTDDRIDGVVLTFVDITVRKRSEDEVRGLAEQLAQQTRLFNTALTGISDFAYIFNREGRFTYSNRPLLELLGISLEEITGKNFFDLGYPEELAARLQAQIEHVFETAQIVRDETPFIGPSGENGFYEYIFSPVFGADGASVESVAGSTRDVTERKRAEMELLQSHQHLQMAMDTGRIFWWQMDMATRQLECSSNTGSVIGFPLPEFIDSAFELIHPEDAERVTNLINAAIESGGRYESEHRLVNPADGEVTWLHSQGSVVGVNGEARFVGIAQNITENKRAQARELNFRQIFESAPGNYLVLEPGTCKIVAASDDYTQTVMQTRAELTGRTIFEVFPLNPEEEADVTIDLRASLERVVAEKRADPMAVQYYPIPRPDGSFEKRWWSPVNSPILGANGEVAYIVHRVEDVSLFIEQERREGRQDAAFAQLEDRATQMQVDVLQRAQELALANERLRASEGKYRALFETMDEAFYIVQVLVDSENRPHDYRFLECNPAFERLTGLRDVVGKTVREIVPEIEPHWIEEFGRVALTGEPSRFDGAADRLGGRCYDGYTFRIGDPQDLTVAIVFSEVTERVRAEKNLALLAAVSQDLVRLTTIDEILPVVGARMGEGFGLSVCAFTEISEDSNTATITHAWHREDVPSLVGEYRIEEFLNEEFARAGRAGELFVVRDTASDERVDARGYASLSVGSFVHVPIVRAGQWCFSLVMFDSAPHDWREDEIELMRELSQRIFARVERAHAENALRLSEKRFRALRDQGADMITVSDSEGRITYASPTTHKVCGYTPEEFMVLSPFNLIHPDDRARCLQALQGLVGSPGISLDLQHRIRHKSGEWRWVEGTFTSLFHEPLIGGLVANVRDITERKRAEEELRESEDQFRTLSDAVPQIIWTNAATGEADYFNSRWFEYSGLGLEQSLGLGWQAIVHPDDALASVEKWQAALQAGQIFDTEYRLRRRDGAYRWFIGRNVPLRDGEGQVVSWFGTATDIEDRKEIEAGLRESEERYRLLVEGARDHAMFLMDANRRIIHWNVGVERIFGFGRDQVLGASGDIIFTPEDIEAGVPEAEARAAEEQGSAADVRWHVRRDGTHFWMDGMMSCLHDESGTVRGFAKIIRDATREREAEEALRRAHDELEARVQERTNELSDEVTRRQYLERDRVRLLRGLVTTQEDERRRLSRELHDQMGQTLTALTLGLKLLPVAEDPGMSRPTPSERLMGLQSLAGEMADYAHHLAWELRPAVLDNIGLEAALSQYVSDWSRRVAVPADFIAHGLSGKERLPTDVESTFYRVTQEALSNVARHAEATQVSVLLERRGEMVTALLEDNGCGFEPGQVSNQLGLIGMRERLELVGGTLTIESAPGEGTVIYARVPLQADEAPAS